jgi:acetyl-CoA carboxylase carboxyltransferase component
VHLAAELVVDAIVQPEDLRTELSQRLSLAAGRVRDDVAKRHGVPPV